MKIPKKPSKLSNKTIDLSLDDQSVSCMFHAMPFGVLIIGPERLIRFINKKAGQILGYNDPGELLLKPVDEILLHSKEGSEPCLEHGGEVISREAHFRSKNGDNIPVLHYSIKMMIQGKEMVLKIFMDLKQQQKVLSELTDKESVLPTMMQNLPGNEYEQLHHVLFEVSKSAFLAKTIDEFYIQVHHHLEKIIDAKNFYIAQYDHISDTISLPYHVDFKDTFKTFPAGKTLTGYVIRTRKPLLVTEQQIEELHKSGEIDIVGTLAKVWLGVPMIVGSEVIGVIAVQSYSDPQQYSHKELNLLEFIANQIAIFIALKKAEAVSEKERAYMAQLFESNPEAIIIINRDNTVNTVNQEFTHLFGYAKEEAQGKDIDVLISTPELFLEARSFSDMVLRGESAQAETKRKHKDGHLIDVSILVTPIIINGEVIGGYGIYRDITDRKKMEKYLIEAKIKAEESDRLKSAFLSNMSHEIRTPMNAILGFSTLLSEPELSVDERAEFIRIIKERGSDLLRIIDDIIDVAKIESGQIKIEISECPVNILLNTILVTLREVRKKQMKTNIDLRFIPGTEGNDFSILTDGNRLRQILTNLIENALKFTDEGYVEFGYTFNEWMSREPVIEFYVKDTGIGIPVESQNMIFERFRQVDDSHTRKYGGTGLGLTIVKNLVQLLGGDIRFDSAHQGTTFFVTLPLQTGITKTEEMVSVKAPSEIPSAGWHNKKILVVEDEESNYFLIERMLRKTRVKVSWAKNGIESIQMCKKEHFDMVLMDIRMPVMDGYEATQEIKKIHRDIPIIAQTAFALKGEKEKSLAAGCDGYIAKPIDSYELMSILKEYLEVS
jgi:PAS domain S-box-containing protein